MAEDKGDVGFVKHVTVEEVVAMGGYGLASDYQYLCKDGSRKGICFSNNRAKYQPAYFSKLERE